MRIIRSPQSRPCPLILFCFLITFLTVTETAYSQNRELSERGKAADTNKDGLIQRSEAGGPLEANFDDMDCDKNGGLDGAEIRGFFTGTGCPEKKAPKIAMEIKTKDKGVRDINVSSAIFLAPQLNVIYTNHFVIGPI